MDRKTSAARVEKKRGGRVMERIELLYRKAEQGKAISKTEALFLAEQEFGVLCAAADSLRKKACGDDFDLCAIINGKSGRCSENCKFCAQSAHYRTGATFYELLDEQSILAAAQKCKASGVRRFSVVTSGKRLTDSGVERLCGIYRRIGEECGLKVCVSHGLLTRAQFNMLKQAGVSRYHNNLETSRRYFPKICTTHSYDDKLAVIRAAQEAGLAVCSGGIIGMGETMEDRIDMVLDLRTLGIRSIPINILEPIDGTPLSSRPVLHEAEAARTAAVFRFLMPDAQIRLAGGRAHLRDRGKTLLGAGVNAAITGDMLTTAGTTAEQDAEMIRSCGFCL